MASSSDDALYPKLHIFESSDAISEDSAKRIAALSARAVQEKGVFTIAFSGGSLPSIVASKSNFISGSSNVS
tara:strand:+ start:516 stop:731 length:216 start_codon:yes stop_codon:yes gene_type:complete